MDAIDFLLGRRGGALVGIVIALILLAIFILRTLAKPVRVLGYNDGWESIEVRCRRRWWKGPLDQGEQEHFKDVIKIWCPRCRKESQSKLALVSLPLDDEPR